jgi:hypothetical protein
MRNRERILEEQDETSDAQRSDLEMKEYEEPEADLARCTFWFSHDRVDRLGENKAVGPRKRWFPSPMSGQSPDNPFKKVAGGVFPDRSISPPFS